MPSSTPVEQGWAILRGAPDAKHVPYLIPTTFSYNRADAWAKFLDSPINAPSGPNDWQNTNANRAKWRRQNVKPIRVLMHPIDGRCRL